MTTNSAVIEVTLCTVEDIVLVRKKVRTFAQTLGFGMADQTRLATAVSELARNALQYASGGKCLVSDHSTLETMVVRVQVSDSGPGIADISWAMGDGYTSGQGMGVGLPGCKRLMDNFTIVSTPDVGTTITVEMHANRR
ncbi:anti-sigma regulatory factor [Marinobacter sediminum]|uniref:anti-sigma regulatory factor n=1 Tax=Marinobacter sediminum TaxID=256323 RepID=UPI00356B316A